MDKIKKKTKKLLIKIYSKTKENDLNRHKYETIIQTIKTKKGTGFIFCYLFL